VVPRPAAGGALALSDGDWQHAFDMNLFAAVRLDRAFLPAMLERGSGVIIHISSISEHFRFSTLRLRTQPLRLL
jgi:NAD(P)-dependent dehydrogenase (short-subunit alcohol dehydrogenase family)